jgi:LacI family transcriptional regulator
VAILAKRITMQDIADKLNISKNSVSQALSGKSGVSEETRQMVQQAADELGYIYSNGKNDKMNATKNLALIASEYTFSLKSFFGEIYLSIEREVNKRGYTLFIQSISAELRDKAILPHIIENNHIDGIIILSHISQDYINKVIATGIPTVVIDHHYPNIQADVILTNNRFGAYTAVEHLINLGHKEIGFVGDIEYSPSYFERLEGYHLALRSHNIEPSREFILSNAQENEEFIDAAIKGLDKQPTAWFCVNDGFGYLVSTGLQKSGIKVPDMASVVSFDNGQLSQIASPKITTMDIDLEYYGRRAIEQLLYRIENPNESFQEILLPAKLIQRGSSAKNGGSTH